MTHGGEERTEVLATTVVRKFFDRGFDLHRFFAFERSGSGVVFGDVLHGQFHWSVNFFLGGDDVTNRQVQ